jgi:hypothetical protein
MNFKLVFRIAVFSTTCLALLSLAACNLPRSAETATPVLDVTQAYQTVAARLTQAVVVTPTVTPATPTALGTSSPTPSTTPTIATPPLISPTPPKYGTATSSCDLAAPGNPIDVTIPDDTVMQPGQSFTKIWRLQNVGTCTWTRSYAAAYFSGEQMGASVSVPLAGNVAPGQSLDISVDMVAPTTPGKFQGNWKLRNASNVLFGIGPNSSAPFWVRIVVAITPTGTTTVTNTPTPTSPVVVNTPTATPVVRVSGTVNLSITDTLDLDTTVINGGAGTDLLFELNGNGQHQLTPQNNAIIGVYGTSQPSKANCQAAPMTSLPIVLENTPVVSYLCYRTDQGLPGYARLSSFSVDSNTATLDVVTWATP